MRQIPDGFGGHVYVPTAREVSHLQKAIDILAAFEVRGSGDGKQLSHAAAEAIGELLGRINQTNETPGAPAAP